MNNIRLWKPDLPATSFAGGDNIYVQKHSYTFGLIVELGNPSRCVVLPNLAQFSPRTRSTVWKWNLWQQSKLEQYPNKSFKFVRVVSQNTFNDGPCILTRKSVSVFASTSEHWIEFSSSKSVLTLFCPGDYSNQEIFGSKLGVFHYVLLSPQKRNR